MRSLRAADHAARADRERSVQAPNADDAAALDAAYARYLELYPALRRVFRGAAIA